MRFHNAAAVLERSADVWLSSVEYRGTFYKDYLNATHFHKNPGLTAQEGKRSSYIEWRKALRLLSAIPQLQQNPAKLL